MLTSKYFTLGVVAAALVAGIGLTYAQYGDSAAPAKTERDAAMPSGGTGTTSPAAATPTTPSTTASPEAPTTAPSDSAGSSSGTDGSGSETLDERAPKADRG